MLALLPGPALSAVAPPTVTLTMTFSRREQGGPGGGRRRDERRGEGREARRQTARLRLLRPQTDLALVKLF